MASGGGSSALMSAIVSANSRMRRSASGVSSAKWVSEICAMIMEADLAAANAVTHVFFRNDWIPACAGMSARWFETTVHLILRFQPRIIVFEDRHHFRPAEFRRDFGIARQHFALLRARDGDVIFRIVRAGFSRRHAIAFAAIKRDIDLERLGAERAGPELVEDGLGIVGAIIIADAGMIAPDDQMRAAEILANKRVQERLARASIAHFDWIAGLNDRSRTEIIVDHRL